jgi:hypothetical protein
MDLSADFSSDDPYFDLDYLADYCAGMPSGSELEAPQEESAEEVEVPGRVVEEQAPAPRRQSRARAYCFTVNNPVSASGWVEMNLSARLGESVKYFVCQVEQGSQGTPHIQGYVVFETPTLFRSASERLPGAHLETARGNAEQNKAYCTKEPRLQGPWEAGEMPRAGRRTDLERVAKSVLTGKRLRDVAVDDPMCFAKYSKGLSMLSKYAPPPAMIRPLVVRLVIGPTGCGKTWSSVMDTEISQEEIYVKGTDQWWDNYNGQQKIVFDDFSGAASKISLPELLRMLDHYRYQLPVKGAYEWCLANEIIITTNIHPTMWYDYTNRRQHYDALARRVNQVVYYREWTAVDPPERMIERAAGTFMVEFPEVKEFFDNPERFPV